MKNPVRSVPHIAKLISLVCASSLLPLSAAEFLRGDVSASAARLANPLKTYGYGDNNATIADLHYYNGRLYMAHGSSSSGNVNRILFIDLNTGLANREGAGVFNEEQITRIRQRGNDLYVHSYDGYSGSVFYYKTPGEEWKKISVNGASDHMRDTIYFGGKVWTSYSSNTFPNMRSAPENAPNGNFSRVSQPAPTDWPADILMDTYFIHAGKLFATSNYTNQFSLYYDPANAAAGWQVAKANYNDVIGSANNPNTSTVGTQTIIDPVETNGVLLFSGLRKLAALPTARNRGLYVTEDFLGGPATPVILGGVPQDKQMSCVYVLEREGHLFAITMANPFQTGSKLTRVWIHQAIDRSDLANPASWQPLAFFSKNAFLGSDNGLHVSSPVEYVDGSFYFVESKSSYPSISNTVADGAGSVWKVPVLPAPESGAYAALRAAFNWGSTPIADRDAEDDANKNGVSNLMEFAFNMNPIAPGGPTTLTPGTGTSGMPAVSVITPATPMLRIEYLRRKTSGLIYKVKFSDDLVTWEDAVATPTPTSINTDWERMVMPDTAGSGRKKRFAKVEVKE